MDESLSEPAKAGEPDVRLEFEKLLVGLSARFVEISPEQIDLEIQSAFEVVLKFFRIDRLALLRLLPDKKNWIIKHNAVLTGSSPYPTGTLFPVALAPWIAGKLIDREVVSFARPEELPEEAHLDRQLIETFQVRSGTYIPIAALRSSEYSLGISSGDPDRSCSEDHIQRLRILGELFVNALVRSETEMDLRESEERLRLAASAADAGLWMMNQESRIVWSTQPFRELFQFTPDEDLPFDRFLETAHPDDREQVRERIRESLEKRETLNMEHRIPKPDGGIRWVSTLGNPSPPTSHGPGRLMGVSIDVTRRKEMEIELRKRLDEIQSLKCQLEKENILLREEVKAGKGFERIIGESDALNYVLFRVRQVAPTDATVLILGETGTGKSVVAHALHELSARKDKALITVNCAALPANLIESELFGRERGAFTGAHARQVGRFEIAHGGTIFLDEIGEMPMELQAKLLRVLQEGEFERLGSPRTISVDVRVIASTSRDLKNEIPRGRFREDLYYRLNVFPISMPPLRMRVGDIPKLVHHFVEKHSRKMGKKFETVTKAAMQALQEYHWPGNVRELEHVIERAVIISTGPVLNLADRLENRSAESESREEPPQEIAAMEREHILRVLRKTNWKINGDGGAAALLGLHPSTLRFRIKKLGIGRP